MHVDLYERIWMWAAAALIGLFLGAICVTTALQAIQPPSHVETVDPATLATHPEFGQPAVTTRPDGSVVVPVVATMFAFAPDPIEVPAQPSGHVPPHQRRRDPRLPVVGTNANAMAIPGYVSQFTVTFAEPGEYTIACNEYCGLMHHAMVGTLIVK